MGMSLTIIPISIDDEFHSIFGCNVACMSMPWLFSIGFTIAFSALFSKIWRLNKVHQSTRRRLKIRERDVLIPFIILFTLILIILIVWTVFDPLKWVRRPVSSQEWDTYGYCTSSGTISIVCMVCLVLVTIVSLVLAIIQSYKARTISDEFSESKYVGIVIICWLQLLVVSLPLIFLVRTNPTASYFLKTALIFVTSTSLLLLMFVPKLILNKRHKTSKQYRRSVRISISLDRNSSRQISPSNSDDEDMNEIRRFNDQGRWSISSSSSINGPTRGMLVINPQLEISDLQSRVKFLQVKNEKLKRRNRELETQLCNGGDANGSGPNFDSILSLKNSSKDRSRRSGTNVVRFDDMEEGIDGNNVVRFEDIEESTDSTKRFDDMEESTDDEQELGPQ